MRSTSNRDYVIKVVADMFLKQGFANTSMDDVVKESGVAKSNIYYHFRSKDDLTLAVLEKNITSLQSLYKECVQATDGTILQQLQAYTEGLIEELVGRNCTGGCPLISLLVEAGRTNQAVQQRLQQFFQQQAAALTASLAEGQKRGEIRADLPTSSLATLIISWLEGSLMLASIQKTGSMMRQERDALLQLLRAP